MRPRRGPGTEDFSADDLLACYRRGVFPMADARHDTRIFLVDPARRGIIPLERPRIPARLARTVRAHKYDIRTDTAFEAVIEACAAPRPGRTETWINRPIQQLFCELHARGVAHSLEAWRGRTLAGGLYGAAIGGAFFGESMFAAERDASKVALVHLIARLTAGGFRLLDAQFVTSHLEQFGAIEISRAEYHHRLATALEARGDFAAGDQAVGAAALQAISQAS
ncbi:MAG TPA: leucyl/phenylalanyl-tRNA--protein transferase [Caulobacteraceae bacterium]|nr:leucyl/phenylalanyl-tRNA--protein transferase [Caulobacteraceae bacterium]